MASWLQLRGGRFGIPGGTEFLYENALTPVSIVGQHYSTFDIDITMLKLIAAASLSSFFFGLFGVSWESVDEKIEREYPQVQTVSTQGLLTRYNEPDEGLPLIIDVRESDEFQVSHLSDALNLGSAESISELIAARGLGKDAEIIVYCSVGYRSAGVAAELQERGYTRVSNLEHSLFEWANKGYPMVDASGQTDKVHPFNTAWGVLVNESLHAYPD